MGGDYRLNGREGGPAHTHPSTELVPQDRGTDPEKGRERPQTDIVSHTHWNEEQNK